MDDEDDALPPMTSPGGLGHALESTGATIGLLLFFLYSSRTFVSSLVNAFGGEKHAVWTGILPALPVVLSSIGGESWKGAMFYEGHVAVAVMSEWIWGTGDGREWVSLLVVAWIVGSAWVLKDVLEVKVSATGVVGVWGVLTQALLLLDLFLVIRPLGGIGWDFALTIVDLIVAVAAGVVVVGVSVSIALVGRWSRIRKVWMGGMDRWKARWPKEVAILLGLNFAALIEELLMRGVVLNLIQRWMGRRDVIPLMIGMVLSGAVHLKDENVGYRAPKWRAALLGAVSSVPYALVWRYTGKVTASAVANTMTEYVCRTFLEKTATE